MAGLKRIILIDTGLFPGRDTFLDVSGHTTATGTNGSGKTSLILLIPFFYGHEPRSLSTHAADKQSFVDFYLPRVSSLLIFEYENHLGEGVCVVASRSVSGSSVVYQFVNAAYAPELFVNDNDNCFFNRDEVSHQWDRLDIEHSPKIQNIREYRSIIQHDTKVIRYSSERKKLQNCAKLCFRKSERPIAAHGEGDPLNSYWGWKHLWYQVHSCIHPGEENRDPFCSEE